jgi:hypothetical protein
MSNEDFVATGVVENVTFRSELSTAPQRRVTHWLDATPDSAIQVRIGA